MFFALGCTSFTFSEPKKRRGTCFEQRPISALFSIISIFDFDSVWTRPHSPCDSSNSYSEIWYGDLGLVRIFGRTLREYWGIRVGIGFELWVHLTKVSPFSCWWGHAPCPLTLFNVHDNIHERTGRSWPPTFIPRAPSTGPTAPFTIYLLH